MGCSWESGSATHIPLKGPTWPTPRAWGRHICWEVGRGGCTPRWEVVLSKSLQFGLQRGANQACLNLTALSLPLAQEPKQRSVLMKGKVLGRDPATEGC